MVTRAPGKDLAEPVAQLLSSLRAAGFEVVEVVWFG
jgi:hypothetical protein